MKTIKNDGSVRNDRQNSLTTTWARSRGAQVADILSVYYTKCKYGTIIGVIWDSEGPSIRNSPHSVHGNSRVNIRLILRGCEWYKCQFSWKNVAPGSRSDINYWNYSKPFLAYLNAFLITICRFLLRVNDFWKRRSIGSRILSTLKDDWLWQGASFTDNFHSVMVSLETWGMFIIFLRLCNKQNDKLVVNELMLITQRCW